MKNLLVFSILLSAVASHAENAPAPRPEPRPVISSAPAPTADQPRQEGFVYDQKPVAAPGPLVSAQQAQEVVERFKATYAKLNSPKVLVYVNRELVDHKSGVVLTARKETTTSTKHSNLATNQNSDTVQAENRYRVADNTPTLADKQTLRDVERLFGRPLRSAGVTLSDQKVASQLLPNRPLNDLSVSAEGEQARKDREVLSKIADVVLEVLISSRNVTVTQVSGDKVYSVPDIQVTAIRLADSKVLGQASSSDVSGQGQGLRHNDVREITEATCLALMEDITNANK
ncbi:MAG: hypothetical protein JWN25_614 [Verrucomicrobiales bacterium]|nr:hypothetical protein [Verrucomicrobiales bacterium]MDB6129083.1 hypothetical protein [Verrucomicrobiales bacterium]